MGSDSIQFMVLIRVLQLLGKKKEKKKVFMYRVQLEHSWQICCANTLPETQTKKNQLPNPPNNPSLLSEVSSPSS